MATRKRILPNIKIKLPELDSTSYLILGNTILFIHLAYDQSPSNPLEDSDGYGNIEQINSREFRGIERTQALLNLWSDDDAVPLRYISHGGYCRWIVEYDHDDIFGAICAERVRHRLAGNDLGDGPSDDFDPDWLQKIHGIWTPDKSTSESYTGQDGLTQRQWMVKQAASACETYTDYCNGSVYGYDIQLHTLRKNDDGEPITDRSYYRHHKELEEDSCWGFYGWEYFKDEVLSVIKSILKGQNFSRRAVDAAIKEAA